MWNIVCKSIWPILAVRCLNDGTEKRPLILVLKARATDSGANPSPSPLRPSPSSLVPGINIVRSHRSDTSSTRSLFCLCCVPRCRPCPCPCRVRPDVLQRHGSSSSPLLPPLSARTSILLHAQYSSRESCYVALYFFVLTPLPPSQGVFLCLPKRLIVESV